MEKNRVLYAAGLATTKFTNFGVAKRVVAVLPSLFRHYFYNYLFKLSFKTHYSIILWNLEFECCNNNRFMTLIDNWQRTTDLIFFLWAGAAAARVSQSWNRILVLRYVFSSWEINETYSSEAVLEFNAKGFRKH